MADRELAIETTEGQRLYSAWRFARAKWELDQYNPENLGDDLPEELEAMHCRADHGALIAYLVHPAEDWTELAKKLRVFRDEDGHGFRQAREIIEVLARDAQELSVEDACRWAQMNLRAA